MSDMNTMIAFLGPVGTYTHESAVFFSKALGLDNAGYLECSSFDDVFDAVERGAAAYGVVAKENSLEGPVTATLDNFAFRSTCVILAEHVEDIHHCLLVSPNATRTGIKAIASHSQGISQCRLYIAENFPGIDTTITSSTASAAKLASQDSSIAAIANRHAADLFGCQILDSDIEDHHGNQTVFALIGRAGSASSIQGDEVKTTLALFLQQDRAGVLNMILSEFAYADINLTMIQSRPLKQQLGDYMFFTEFLLPDTNPRVQTALACLRLKLREVKVLGSYPII